MAQQLVSDITAAIATLYQDKVRSAFNRKAALASKLAVEDATGQKVTWTVAVTDNTPGSIYVAEGTGVGTPNSADGYQKAELDFARCLESLGVSDLAIAKAATTGNPMGLQDLPAKELVDVAERFFSKMNAELYTGSGAANTIVGFVGATNAALGATGSYAGLARGTYAKWAATNALNGGTPRAITVALVRNTLVSIVTACGESPTAIVMAPAQQAALANLMNTNIQYRMGDDGINNAVFSFDGIPVVADFQCPADKVFFINQSETKLIQLPQVGLPYLTMGNGLKIYIEKIAPDGSGVKYGLKSFVQLQVGKPNLMGYLGDLS